MDANTIEELRALEKAATSAPWEVDSFEERNMQECSVQIIGPGNINNYPLFESGNCVTRCIDQDDDGRWYDVGSRPNFEFIAAMRNNAVSLIEAAADRDRLRAEVGVLTEKFKLSCALIASAVADRDMLADIIETLSPEVQRDIAERIQTRAANAQAGGEGGEGCK